jgi:hypothetical protein
MYFECITSALLIGLTKSAVTYSISVNLPGLLHIHYMSEPRYQVGVFAILQTHSIDIFNRLADTNRITINKNIVSKNDSKKRLNKEYDPIYIRANYLENSKEYQLLLSNDARRKVRTLFLKRVEQMRLETDMITRLEKAFGGTSIWSCFSEVMELVGKFRYSGSNSFIAGSFPLQVYLNESWKDSDIDIFTTGKYISQHLISKNYRYKIIFSKDMEDVINSVNSRYAGKFDSVIEFTLHTGTRLQVIQTEAAISMDTVLGSFDFDFCKVAWDGHSFTMHNRGAIDKRECEYNVNRKINHKCAERLAKYESRGFTITNREEMLKLASTK